jgi:hypothetical protein
MIVSEQQNKVPTSIQTSFGNNKPDYHSRSAHHSAITETKYQDIEYCMLNRHKKVFYDAHTKIDFQTAKNELKGLDWTYTKNGISFYNNKKDESLFCHRLQKEKWLVATPIKVGVCWTGYEWVASPGIDSIIYTLRLFFEETPWFHTLSWQRTKWSSDYGC